MEISYLQMFTGCLVIAGVRYINKQSNYEIIIENSNCYSTQKNEFTVFKKIVT